MRRSAIQEDMDHSRRASRKMGRPGSQRIAPVMRLGSGRRIRQTWRRRPRRPARISSGKQVSERERAETQTNTPQEVTSRTDSVDATAQRKPCCVAHDKSPLRLKPCGSLVHYRKGGSHQYKGGHHQKQGHVWFPGSRLGASLIHRLRLKTEAEPRRPCVPRQEPGNEKGARVGKK